MDNFTAGQETVAIPQSHGRPTSVDPTITAAPGLPGFYRRRGKRLFDLAGALVLSILFLPLLVLIALVLMSKNGRPVLFRQERVGLGGATFRVMKFRTMEPERRQTIAIDYAGPERRNGHHKTTTDPRHTKTGTLLRRCSLDELPQLWNVLVGDMSLVGPRPELLNVADVAGIRDHVRHSVRPGITGPWQISHDRDGFLSENLHYDEVYVASLSFRGDIMILLRTVGTVLKANGA